MKHLKHMKHQACNTSTGEVISAVNGNLLKKLVASANRYKKSLTIFFMTYDMYSKYIHSWVFCHDGRFLTEENEDEFIQIFPKPIDKSKDL